MRKIFFTLLFVATVSYAQNDYNRISLGLSVGMLSEMGSVKTEGLNPVFDLNVSKHITSQVSVSTNFMYGVAKGGADNQVFDANLSAMYMNLAYHIIQLEKIAIYLQGGVGLLGFSGEQDNVEYEQNLFGKKSFIGNRSLGLKYQLFDNININLDFSLMNPLAGKGLDNASEDLAVNGFHTIKFGAIYTFGNKMSNHAEWANPVDVVSNKVKEVEKDISDLSIDTDGDGVSDKFDKENDTPLGVAVDGSGRALDVDADGVPDYKDTDPFTAPGVQVNESGLELDDDKDGVPNSKDVEPNSPVGCTVNFQGRQIVGKGAFLPTVFFDVSSTDIDYGNYQRLATVASVMKANPSYTLRVIGFADSVGASEANYRLGLKRANAVIEILINTFGIDINRMIADSQGENNLLANEQQKIKLQDGMISNADGTRFLNRRVEFIIE